MSDFHRRTWMFLILLAWPQATWAQAEQPPPAKGGPEPVAVMALISSDQSQAVVPLAAAVQSALERSGRVPVIPARDVSAKLSGGGSLQSLGEATSQDLARLRGMFQQGTMQSYGFEYQAAVVTFKNVLVGLDGLASSNESLELYVQCSIHLGMALAGLRDEEGCLRAFVAAQLVRPSMSLSRDQYPNKIIELWKKAQQRLTVLPRGAIAVESDPVGAFVFLDGVKLGNSPNSYEVRQGRHLLTVQHPASGKVSRWIEVGVQPIPLQLQLAVESALSFEQDVPLVLIRQDRGEVPDSWWRWLGARIGAHRLVLVSHQRKNERVQAVISLVDLDRSKKLREGWLEPSGQSVAEVDQDARDLMDFVVTGQGCARLTVVLNTSNLDAMAAGDPAREAAVVEPFPSKPWHRRFWTYGIAGAAFLSLGVSSHLVSSYHQRTADNAQTEGASRYHQQIADSWLGVAIGGYALGAAALITGWILDWTYSAEDQPISGTPVQALPWAGKGFMGWQIHGRF